MTINYTATFAPTFTDYVRIEFSDNVYKTIENIVRFYKNKDLNFYINNFRFEGNILNVFFTKTRPAHDPISRVVEVEERVVYSGGGCWEDDVLINIKGKGWMLTRDIAVGDYVQVADGGEFTKVLQVMDELCHSKRIVCIGKIGLTQGHPVLDNGWKRADEVDSHVRNMDDKVVRVFNLALDSHHSVFVKKEDQTLTVATHGKYPMGWRYHEKYGKDQ